MDDHVDGNVLEIDGLVRRFGDVVAVDDLSLQVARGETYGLLGPNGAGKTTAISVACGLLEADAGTVTVLGDRMTPTSLQPKAAIGYVPQDLAIYPDLSGRENLEFFARVHGLDRRRRNERVDAVLEVVDLADRADDRADEYSGGMKRRLNIAIGLLHEPRLLVLDEPTVGVDPQSRDAILRTVEELAGGGMSVLYTTHYMEEAQRLCDRIGIIDHGHLVAEGTRRELVAQTGDADRITIDATGPLDEAVLALRDRPGVHAASERPDGIDLTVDDARATLADVLATLGADVTISSVEVVEPDLESVFLHLTGRALRD